MDNKQSLTIDATKENFNTVMGFVEERLDEMGCPMKITMKISVAVDEIITNIISYAYQPNVGKMTVVVEKQENPDRAIIRFYDQGIPFDPLVKEDPNINLTAEERRIGGLGIYMVKNMMDDVEYRYTDGNNLIITKNFN